MCLFKRYPKAAEYKKGDFVNFKKNGELMKTIDSTEMLLQASEFDKLLEEYEVE